MKNLTYIKTEQLKPFENHPYQVKDDEEMQNLTESIKGNGILSPLIVRPIGNDKYEVISGHRRLHASKTAGLTEVPAFIYEMDRNAASILVVDSNLHREHILPSEKAFAYKMKMDSLSHQGKSSLGQVVPKADENRTTTEIGKDNGESYKTVQRYIRLTNLIPEILEYVDEGRISFTSAVELSYLKEQEQFDLLEAMESEDCTPSLFQAVRMKKMSQSAGLNSEYIYKIMNEEKANQKERIKIPTERVRKFFPSTFSNAQIEDAIVKLCEAHYQKKRKHRGEMDR